MKLKKITNARDFEIEVKYSEADKEVVVKLAPGQEIELAEDQATAVETQLSEAVAPETPEAKAAREAEEEKNLSEADKNKRDLAEARKELRKRDIEAEYTKALSDGKIVPAQEEAFKALSSALYGKTRNLSDGKTQNLSDLLANFIAKAPKVVSYDENGKKTNDEDTDPASKLSEETKQGLAKSGITPEQYIKSGAAEGSISIGDLTNENKEN